MESERVAVGGPQRAGRRVGDNIDSVRAPAWTSGWLPNVGGRAKEVGVCRAVGVDFFGFQRPGCLGSADLLEVRNTGTALGGSAGFDEVRNSDGGQQSDDGDNNHDFHQGKAGGTVGFHSHLILSFYYLWQKD